MSQDEVDKIRAAQDWPKAMKLITELGKRVEALEKNGKVEEPAAPTSASEIPDVTPAPTPEPSAEPVTAPAETPASETPAQ